MRRSNRLRWLGAIAIGIMILLTLIAAPTNSRLNRGSTYSLAPDGYGAWYAFMQQRGKHIQRWQKPLSELPTGNSPITLLRINSQLNAPILSAAEQDWVEQGNTLVVLGVWEKVSEARFSTMQPSSVGNVKIDTRRRHQVAKEQLSLGDRFGAVVWIEHKRRGKVIFSTTPYLAANAYQDYPSNYMYLAQLLSQSSTIWVDEYIHGYLEPTTTTARTARSWVAYLAHTPLLPTFLQGSILLLVVVWAQNQRFGVPRAIEAPVVNNSEAYVQALAGVLRKAECSEFVLDVVGKEEQLQLQKALGLGQVPLEPQTIISAWVQQTGTGERELEELLQRQAQHHRVSERELLNWLGKWQKIQHQL